MPYLSVMLFPDKTVPIRVDLEHIDPDTKTAETFRRSKQEFHGKVVISKDGEWTISNVKCVEEIQDGDKTIKRIVVGSVRFDMYCATQTALDELWSNYTSGHLHKHFAEHFDIHALKEKFKLPNLFLNVLIRDEQYELCKQEIERAPGKGNDHNAAY